MEDPCPTPQPPQPPSSSKSPFTQPAPHLLIPSFSSASNPSPSILLQPGRVRPPEGALSAQKHHVHPRARALLRTLRRRPPEPPSVTGSSRSRRTAPLAVHEPWRPLAAAGSLDARRQPCLRLDPVSCARIQLALAAPLIQVRLDSSSHSPRTHITEAMSPYARSSCSAARPHYSSLFCKRVGM
ncbi:uncharacterized protein LOC123439832 [Hordeum vulgare subsp. vulgare]|uniref:uncharacterized protein LOC123439832 n=1 Tax=Hordeum vulgare subsp. vulgare TaxID=112509 RepID=UPI001D1A3947|nr:uncharacterized protein LOC123439832 [Hordeum vulgare subsp. vulgare]